MTPVPSSALRLRRLAPCALLASALLTLHAPAQEKQAPPASSVTAERASQKISAIRVNVTNQSFDFARPWGKHQPRTRRAVGAVISPNRVLVTAEMVQDANYVELEMTDGGRKAPAKVAFVDYQCNLALLETDDPDFVARFAPLERSSARVGDSLSIWQIEENGNLRVTQATLTSAEVLRTPIDDFSVLFYRMTSQLQARNNSYVLPVLKEGKLVGLLVTYDTQSGNADVIAAPVIEHFLADVAKPPYEGFPRAGIGYAGMRDPQLRRFAGLGDRKGGIWINDVLKGGPAEKAGLKKGDVLLQIDDQPVDADGNYNDVDYGKIDVSHLLSTRHEIGDSLKFTIWRDGASLDLNVKLEGRKPTQAVIDPYILDRPAKFYVLGGLVLQELSRQYLKEWGSDWWKKAPQELVYMDRLQNELFGGETRKIVFLSRVLPSDATLGYEELTQLIVTKINGQEIRSLADVPAALAKVENGIHKIEFTDHPTVIYLDAEAVAASDQVLAKTYRLPALKRLE